VTGLLLVAFLAIAALAHGRQAGEFVELVLIGCNDDFNSRGSNVAGFLAHDPDFIFIQEGKAADYRNLRGADGKKLLPIHTWGVHQDTRHPERTGRSGSVVIYRHDAFTRSAGGFTLGVRARGLLPRWTAWLRGQIHHVRVFLFSTHRPPVRARAFWHPFDLATWARVRLALATGRVVLGQMDSNEHGGPPNLLRGLRWVALGRSIDGFVLSRSVEVLQGPQELPKDTSDHHPIKLRVRIPVSGRTAA
jgi:hypothetical protein